MTAYIGLSDLIQIILMLTQIITLCCVVFILFFNQKVYKKSSKILHIWILRRFFVYTLIKK